MSQVHLPFGTAYVKMYRKNGRFQAHVWRDKMVDGTVVQQIEYTIERDSEGAVRTTLRRCGYPYARAAVPVVPVY